LGDGQVSTVYLVPAADFIKALSEELKKTYTEAIHAPPWGEFVKTGAHRTRPPTQRDWWYTRCASLLRKLYVKNPIGVSRLRFEYGGPSQKDVTPNRHTKGSGSIIRKLLQQLEGAGLVEKKETDGRKLTTKGTSLLDRVAHKVRLSLQKEAVPDLRKY